jgi:hypothetical protein
MGIQEIKQAISKLAPKDLASFREWYEQFDAQAWDAQIEADAAAGKLDKLAEQAEDQYRAGKFTEL